MPDAQLKAILVNTSTIDEARFFYISLILFTDSASSFQFLLNLADSIFCSTIIYSIPHSTIMTLQTFSEMWYQIFLWALFSSVFVHTIAAGICFLTLRKHKYGKFFPLLILVMGILIPLTSGAVSSAAIAFVYCSAGYQMSSLYALLWGIGHTVLTACIGFTRILATL